MYKWLAAAGWNNFKFLYFSNVDLLGNAYNADERTVAAGYDNGDIKLFDLKNMSLRWETNVKNGVSWKEDCLH